jgi:hypothetical protein
MTMIAAHMGVGWVGLLQGRRSMHVRSGGRAENASLPLNNTDNLY